MILTKRWNRRAFLRAAGICGAASALLPMLPKFGEAATEGAKRLLLLSTPNGTNIPLHRPLNPDGSRAVDGAALTGLSSFVLAPLLEAHAEKLSIIEGLDLRAYYNNLPARNMSGHYAAATLFTGNSGRGEPTGEADLGRYPGSISIDQIIANQMATEAGADSRVHSIAARVDAGSPAAPGTNQVYTFREDGTPVIGAHDPRTVFAELFGDYDADGGVSQVAEQRRRRDLRIVELHRAEFTRLKAQIPYGDRDRFEAHIESFRALEASVHGGTLSCAVPEAPGRPGAYEQLLWDHTELVKHAFACDRTRVIQLSLGDEAGSNSMVTSLPEWQDHEGHRRSHHTSSHLSRNADEVGVAAAHNVAIASRAWAQHISQLLTDLSVPISDGRSILDDTVVVWAMPMSHGGHHAAAGTIAMVAQGANGPFVTNQYRHFGSIEIDDSGSGYCANAPEEFRGSSCAWEVGVPHNQFLVSLLQGFGIDQDRIGDPSIERGGLSGVLR